MSDIDLISSKLNIPYHRVSELLRQNPITQTICPYCKKTVIQTPGKTMRIFCGHSCYYSWYRLHGIKGTLPKRKQQYTPLSNSELFLIWNYQSQYVPQKQIHKLTGISEQKISSFYQAKRPPCKYCGIEIPLKEDTKYSQVFCSHTCSNKWHNRNKNIIKRTKPKDPRGRKKKALPSSEQLNTLANMCEENRSVEEISQTTVLPAYQVKKLKVQ